MELELTATTLNVTSIDSLGYSFVHIIQKITTTSTTIYDSNITEGTSEFVLETDGYYIVSEIKILDTESPGFYYTDGESIYDTSGEEITIQELLDLDIEGTNLEREDQDLVTYYLLNTYYVDLVKSKFLKKICTCSCVRDSDKLTIDTLTMGLYAIQSLVDYEQYYEAERLIEQLGVCSGVVNTNCNCYD